MTQAKRPPPFARIAPGAGAQPRVAPVAQTPSTPERKGPPPLPGAASPAAPAYRTFIAGRYSLEKVVGTGGMGEVWAAYDRTLGRRVAIKLVDLETSALDNARARFTREIALSHQLRGPAFAEMYAHGAHGDRVFLVMELLEGETLQDRLRRVHKLALDEVHDLLKGVAVGLRVAHALQVVHRDLKPSNIFFAKIKATSGARPLDGRKEIVKVLDFGIAKESWSTDRLTRPGVLMGSAHYMSPEQIRAGYDVDSRSDLWSLAIVLYRSMTGERPFPGSAGEALAGIVHEDPIPVTRIDPSLPRGLDWFFKTAFQKDPARRFQTVDDMLEAFALSITSRVSDDRDSPVDVEVEWVESVRPTAPTRVERRAPPSATPPSQAVTTVLGPKAASRAEAAPPPSRISVDVEIVEDARETVLERPADGPVVEKQHGEAAKRRAIEGDKRSPAKASRSRAPFWISILIAVALVLAWAMWRGILHVDIHTNLGKL